MTTDEGSLAHGVEELVALASGGDGEAIKRCLSRLVPEYREAAVAREISKKFEETVKLIDFGVARLREVGDATGLTGRNHLIGSMGYMAPEQFHNAKGVGPTADLPLRVISRPTAL